jgi:predicted cytidylate kinase
MRITISGPPGSGKTTVCNILSKRLGAEAVVFGTIFRSYAAEKGLTLSELGHIAENDPSIDEAIDSKILEIARSGDGMILESRLSAYMLSRNGIPAFKVCLDACAKERIRRIGLRDGESEEDAEENTSVRQDSEAKRYMQYYGIDINDRSVYDLIVNTDDKTPEQVADTIIKAMG